MSRRQDIFRVSGGTCSVDCNTYQLPGVKWAFSSLFPGVAIQEKYLGKGNLNFETKKAENLK